MDKFLFVYRRGSDAANKMTPEEMQQHMQKWHTWIGEGLQKGWMLERGDPLRPEKGRKRGRKRGAGKGPEKRTQLISNV